MNLKKIKSELQLQLGVRNTYKHSARTLMAIQLHSIEKQTSTRYKADKRRNETSEQLLISIISSSTLFNKKRALFQLQFLGNLFASLSRQTCIPTLKYKR